MFFALVAAAAAAVIWWLAVPHPTAEERILDLVAQIEHGVETKNSQEIMRAIALNYHDKAGLTRTDLGKLAFRWQRTPEQVQVLISDYALKVDGSKAIGEFEVELTFSDGTKAEQLSLTVEFERQRKSWFRKVWLVTSVVGHGLEDDVIGLT